MCIHILSIHVHEFIYEFIYEFIKNVFIYEFIYEFTCVNMNSYMNSYIWIFWRDTSWYTLIHMFFSWIHIWIHDFSWIHIWIHIWILCQDTSWYTRIHSFSWNYARYHGFWPLFMGERRDHIGSHVVKNIVKLWKICMNSSSNSWARCADAQYLMGAGHSAAAAPEHLPHCQHVYLAELKCQYLTPWSCHTLSSCCQRA